MSKMTVEDAAKALTQAQVKMIYHKATGVAFMVVLVLYVQDLINNVSISIVWAIFAGIALSAVINKARKVGGLQQYTKDLKSWIIENS